MSENSARKETTRLIDAMDTGAITGKWLAIELLNWLSEAEVAEFTRRKDIFIYDEDSENDREE